jgi:hypothetical protein
MPIPREYATLLLYDLSKPTLRHRHDTTPPKFTPTFPVVNGVLEESTYVNLPTTLRGSQFDTRYTHHWTRDSPHALCVSLLFLVRHTLTY